MRTPKALLVSIAVFLVAALSSLSSLAQARDPAAAEALFAEAQELVVKGDYAKACPKLQESYRLDPATGALYALALCHERQGKLASAWVEFMDVASRANAEGYSDRERAARERALAIKDRLSFLVLRVPPETAALSGLVLARGGVALGRAAWGTPIPIDPGTHEVSATAPGHAPWYGTVSIAPGPSTVTVDVPKLLAASAAEAPPSAGSPSPRSPGGEFLGVRMTPLRTLGLALGTAGIASLGLATYSLVRAIDKNADSKDDCDAGGCGVEGERDRIAAFEAADLATVSGVAGGVLGAAGVVLFVVGAPAGEQVALAASPGGIHFSGSF